MAAVRATTSVPHTTSLVVAPAKSHYVVEMGRGGPVLDGKALLF